MASEDEDTTTYDVVAVNDEEQYSIWPQDRAASAAGGVTGPAARGPLRLDHIERCGLTCAHERPPARRRRGQVIPWRHEHKNGDWTQLGDHGLMPGAAALGARCHLPSVVRRASSCGAGRTGRRCRRSMTQAASRARAAISRREEFEGAGADPDDVATCRSSRARRAWPSPTSTWPAEPSAPPAGGTVRTGIRRRPALPGARSPRVPRSRRSGAAAAGCRRFVDAVVGLDERPVRRAADLLPGQLRSRRSGRGAPAASATQRLQADLRAATAVDDRTRPASGGGGAPRARRPCAAGRPVRDTRHHAGCRA